MRASSLAGWVVSWKVKKNVGGFSGCNPLCSLGFVLGTLEKVFTASNYCAWRGEAVSSFPLWEDFRWPIEDQ